MRLKATMVFVAYTIPKPPQSLGLKQMLCNGAPMRGGGWGKQDLTEERRGPELQVQGTASVSPASAKGRQVWIEGDMDSLGFAGLGLPLMPKCIRGSREQGLRALAPSCKREVRIEWRKIRE